MRTRVAVIVAALIMAMVAVSWAQDNKATVEMGNVGSFKQGETIVFNVKFDEPLPKGASLMLHISPVSSVTEDIQLSQSEMVNAKTFRISYKLPEGAFPGEWHMTGVYLFLPGSRMANNIGGPKDLRFKVEGKPYQIPTKADVTVGH
ncbi:MAG: hypothetical protein ABSC14_09030 [Desulfomonilia bacterium]|jgi:hypothetical protein